MDASGIISLKSQKKSTEIEEKLDISRLRIESLNIRSQFGLAKQLVTNTPREGFPHCIAEMTCIKLGIEMPCTMSSSVSFAKHEGIVTMSAQTSPKKLHAKNLGKL